MVSQPLGRLAALALMSVCSNRKEVESFGIRLHVAATAAELGHLATAPPRARQPGIRLAVAGGAAPGLALG